MGPRVNKLGELPDRRAGTPRSREQLERWMADYRDSVGPSSDICVELLARLNTAEALDSEATDRAAELLETLDALSADPVTVSCALMHVAVQGTADLSSVAADLPAPVKRQLADLEKLKHYESGQSLSGTERSAEGLRRLLLALVKDVRVVLIDLAWQLVVMRRAEPDSPEFLGFPPASRSN